MEKRCLSTTETISNLLRIKWKTSQYPKEFKTWLSKQTKVCCLPRYICRRRQRCEKKNFIGLDWHMNLQRLLPIPSVFGGRVGATNHCWHVSTKVRYVCMLREPLLPPIMVQTRLFSLRSSLPALSGRSWCRAASRIRSRPTPDASSIIAWSFALMALSYRSSAVLCIALSSPLGVNRDSIIDRDRALMGPCCSWRFWTWWLVTLEAIQYWSFSRYFR